VEHINEFEELFVKLVAENINSEMAYENMFVCMPVSDIQEKQ
jgi:hypothetical protein